MPYKPETSLFQQQVIGHSDMNFRISKDIFTSQEQEIEVFLSKEISIP